MLCSICKHDPCKAILYRDFLTGELSVINDSLSNSKKRNHLYRCFVFGEHGTLGRCNRVRIPECVVAFIRSICPDPENSYTGHRDIDEDGNECYNESFESVLPDSHEDINFDAGEKAKVCVSFENNQFDITKVREFITQSPVGGWYVTFSGDEFTNATIVCSTKEIYRDIFVYCMMNVARYTQVVYDKV